MILNIKQQINIIPSQSYFILLIPSLPLPSMIPENCLLPSKLAESEYLSHWFSYQQLSKLPKKGRQFQKLKILPKFTPEHESTIIRLYLQKIYLLSIAQELNATLQTSISFYELKDGLVFGVYSFKNYEEKKYKGIEMREEEKSYLKNVYDNCLGEMIKKIMNECGKKNIPENSQFPISINNLVELEQQLQRQNVVPKEFLKILQKQPLSEHYLYKIKFKNAMLTPIFFEDEKLMSIYQGLKEEQKEIFEAIQLSGQRKKDRKQFQRFHEIMLQLIDIIYKNNRIGWLDGNKRKEHAFTYDFVIILSQYRNNVSQKIQEKYTNEKQKKNENTKIQIKACNGMIQPKSGNAIFVKIKWNIIWEKQRPFFEVKIQCFSNRKVEELYYCQVFDFWQELLLHEDFQKLLAFQKIVINRNEESFQIVFSSVSQQYSIPNTFKELDNIVSLLIAMDEVIEIAEKKGLEGEDPTELSIKPYLLQNTKMRLSQCLSFVKKYHQYI